MVIEIFCCYAREDKALLNAFKKHLSPLERQKIVKIWDDTDINAGAEWEHEIEKHLNTAHIILLFVSADFMASEYCYSKEMKYAVERHERGEARVIPIIIRHTFWEIETIRKLQALPPDGKAVGDADKHTQDKAFKRVVEGIRKVVEELAESLSASDIPPVVTHLNQLNQLDQTVLGDATIIDNEIPLTTYAKREVLGSNNSQNSYILQDNIPLYIRQAISMTDSINSEERIVAFKILSQSKHPIVNETIIKLQFHELREIRIQAALILADSNNSLALPGLFEAIEDSAERYEAEKKLKRFIDGSSVSILLEILRSKKLKAYTLSKVIEMLGEIGDEAAIPDLIDALKYNDMSFMAVEALGKIGSKEAIPALIMKLEKDKGFLGQKIAKILGSIGDADIIPELFKMLRNLEKEKDIREKETKERDIKWAISGIGNNMKQSGDKSIIPYLLNSIHDQNEHIRESSITLLGYIGDKSNINDLLEALYDEDTYVRNQAIYSLCRISDKTIIPHLIKVLHNLDYEDKPPSMDTLICEKIINALGNIRDASATPDLLDILKRTSGSLAVQPLKLWEILEMQALSQT